MKIGCCVNMVAAGADGTGYEKVESLARLGYDYVEMPLAQMTALPEEDFRCLRSVVEGSGIRCETCNGFFPADIRLTGPDVNLAQVDAYVEKATDRAAALGVECVVFGSGPAKQVPKGFCADTAFTQVVEMLRRVAPIAGSKAITIAIEPLRGAECNMINNFYEGCRLAQAVADANVKVLVDYYHLRQEGEPVSNVIAEGPRYLHHVHFARNAGRVFPARLAEENYGEFFDALKAIGYDRRISIEAYTQNFEHDAKRALAFFREQF